MPSSINERSMNGALADFGFDRDPSEIAEVGFDKNVWRGSTTTLTCSLCNARQMEHCDTRTKIDSAVADAFEGRLGQIHDWREDCNRT